MQRAIERPENPVGRILREGAPPYVAWFPEWRSKRNAVKEGVGFSTVGPTDDIGVAFNKVTSSGGVVVNLHESNVIRLHHLVAALALSAEASDLASLIASGAPRRSYRGRVFHVPTSSRSRVAPEVLATPGRRVARERSSGQLRCRHASGRLVRCWRDAVDHVRIKICAVRPRDRACLLVDANAPELAPLAQCREHSPIEERLDVNVSNLTVGEGHAHDEWL